MPPAEGSGPRKTDWSLFAKDTYRRSWTDRGFSPLRANGEHHMNSNGVGGSGPPQKVPPPAPAGPDPMAVLHGRLLNVSRMATIGEMAAGVAHELNQPLTAIANYAQACDRLLARPISDPSDLREALRQITAQPARAADIIRRLRTLARSHQSERAPARAN